MPDGVSSPGLDLKAGACHIGKGEGGGIWASTPAHPRCGTKSRDFQCPIPRPRQTAREETEAMSLGLGVEKKGPRVSFVTGRGTMAAAQRHNAGFDRVRRGFPLNKLHKFANDPRFQRSIGSTHFCTDGPCNPQEKPSRAIWGGQKMVWPFGGRGNSNPPPNERNNMGWKTSCLNVTNKQMICALWEGRNHTHILPFSRQRKRN